MTYTFEAYDVLQILRDSRSAKWQDFSTLRTETEAAQAVALCDLGIWNGDRAEFRIVGNSCAHIVKYSGRKLSY